MKLNKTDLMILNAIHNRYGSPTVSELYADLPAGLFANKRALSSRLCEMRSRNLLSSKTLDNGVNEWMLSEAGGIAIKGQALIRDTDITPDISAETGIPVTEQNQEDSPDISADISERNPDPIAAEFAAAIAAAEEVVDAEWPATDPNPPVGADAEHFDVAPDLIEEANSLRLRRPLPREQDALYVLSVLIDILGRDHPGMAYELTRIAAYIEGESA